MAVEVLRSSSTIKPILIRAIPYILQTQKHNQKQHTMRAKNHKQTEIEQIDGISRKQAIKRMGKYAAVTAIGAFIILNPMKAQAASASAPANPNGNPFGN